MDRFIEEAEQKGKPFRRSKIDTLNTLKAGIDSIALKDFDEGAIEEYANRRIQGDVTGNKMKGSTISQELAFLNGSLIAHSIDLNGNMNPSASSNTCYNFISQNSASPAQ